MNAKEIVLIVMSSILINGGLFARSEPLKEPQYFYVGTYTEGGSKGIYIYSIDPVTGKHTHYLLR